MVDTIHLETENFEISNISHFRVQTDPIHDSNNLFLGHNSQGQKVFGYAAFATHKPKDSHLTQVNFKVSTTHNRKFLTIEIASLPRILYVHNLFAFDTQWEFEAAGQELIRILEKKCISVLDLEELRVTRMDLCYTILTNREAREYIQKLQNTTVTAYSKTVYRSGAEFKSRSKVFAFYDKRLRLKNIREYFGKSYDPFAGMDSKDNQRRRPMEQCLMRMEIQLNSAEIIRKSFGHHLFWGSFLSNTTIQNLRQFFHVSTTKFLDKILNERESKPNRVSISRETIQDFIVQLKQKYGSNWYSRTVKIFGEMYLHEFFKGKFLEEVKNLNLLTLNDGGNRGSIDNANYRITKSNKDGCEEFKELTSHFVESSELDSLIQELREQLSQYSWVIFEQWKNTIEVQNSIHFESMMISEPIQIHLGHYNPDRASEYPDFGETNRKDDILTSIAESMQQQIEAYRTRAKLLHSEGARLLTEKTEAWKRMKGKTAKLSNTSG